VPGNTTDIALSGLERRLLQMIQADFPLDRDPYGQLAERLQTTPDATHAAVQRLRDTGVIRRIGASYVPARLGYVTSLVAAAVTAEHLEAVAARASGFTQVTHNYEREARFNLWFTVIASSRVRLRATVAAVAAAEGVRQIQVLPALRTFKLRVAFPFLEVAADASSNRQDQAATGSQSPPALRPNTDPCTLDAVDKRLIARTCGDIGAGRDPYAALAAELGLPRAEMLARLRGYRADGLMRRFGAMLRHVAAGFAANGMAVLNVADERVADVGRRLAACPEISHCYERPRFHGWPYNLYAMIHGHEKSEVRELARAMAAAAGTPECRVLFSCREFKKTSMTYFAEDPGPHARP